MHDTDKTAILNELLSGVLFDDYTLDNSKKHFALAPKDVVKVDLRSYIQKVVADIKALNNATWGQVSIDEVTGDVTVGGKPSQSQGNNDQVAAGGASPATDQAAGEDPGKVSPDAHTAIVEFLRLLQKNGALDKLSELDPEVKKQMADEILKLIQNQNKAPEAAAEVPLPPMPQKAPAQGDPSLNESFLLKEAFIILFEADASNVSGTDGQPNRAKVKNAVAGMDSAGKKTAALPAAAPAATPDPAKAPVPATPATPPTQAPSTTPTGAQDPSKAKVKDVLEHTKDFKIDDQDKLKKVTAYQAKLKQDYAEVSQIPGAKEVEILAVVQSFDQKTGKASVKMLTKGETLPDGKANYKLEGEPFNVPQNAVKERMPVQQAQKTGLLSRIFGR